MNKAILAGFLAALLVFPASAELNDQAKRYQQAYQKHIGSSEFLDQLNKLGTLVEDNNQRLCKLAEAGCIDSIAPLSEDAEQLARSILTSATPEFPRVPSAEDPIPNHRSLFLASKSMWVSTLEAPMQWHEQMEVTIRWCEQQIDLIGYMICIANIEDGLAIGQQLDAQFTQGDFQLSDQGLKTAMLGEWASIASLYSGKSGLTIIAEFADENVSEENLSEEEALKLIDPVAMLNHHYDYLNQWYAMIDGTQTEIEPRPCSECGAMGEILAGIASPSYSDYLARHRQVQVVLKALER